MDPESSGGAPIAVAAPPAPLRGLTARVASILARRLKRVQAMAAVLNGVACSLIATLLFIVPLYARRGTH